MERTNRYADVTLIIVFCVMIALTIALSWYRLIVHENFRYVVHEEDTPERLDLSTY